LHSWHDMVTVHEVFCRLDYLAPPTVRTVVDIGSNIGVSALYFLSRNVDTFCYLAEPDPRNIARLHMNLAPYSARYALEDCAVSDSAGIVEFGIESTGRYGGIGLDLDEAILVRCREINAFLDDVIADRGSIDVLKVDTEGLEERTIKAIDPDLLRRIRVIYFESPEPLEGYRPESLVQSRRLLVTRLTPRS
jgi:FkbM family methyltransferase